jgi:hypothetical protein
MSAADPHPAVAANLSYAAQCAHRPQDIERMKAANERIPYSTISALRRSLPPVKASTEDKGRETAA